MTKNEFKIKLKESIHIKGKDEELSIQELLSGERLSDVNWDKLIGEGADELFKQKRMDNLK
jgi:hypothetical protein